MHHTPFGCAVLQVGKKNRSVGATLMNQDSSRSHSVFTITIETIEQGPASVSDDILDTCMKETQGAATAIAEAGAGAAAAGVAAICIGHMNHHSNGLLAVHN